MLHRLSAVSCTQRTPAGLPSFMPGIGEEMDMAIQHAAQPVLHSKVIPPSNSRILNTKMSFTIHPTPGPCQSLGNPAVHSTIGEVPPMTERIPAPNQTT